VFGWVSYTMIVQDADSKTADCIMDCYVIVNKWQLRLEREELFVVFSKGLLLLAWSMHICLAYILGNSIGTCREVPSMTRLKVVAAWCTRLRLGLRVR
jgi:hypothetical protein